MTKHNDVCQLCSEVVVYSDSDVVSRTAAWTVVVLGNPSRAHEFKNNPQATVNDLVNRWSDEEPGYGYGV